MSETEKENLETKYPNLKTLSRNEIDQLILNQLEILANELARVAKLTQKVLDRV